MLHVVRHVVWHVVWHVVRHVVWLVVWLAVVLVMLRVKYESVCCLGLPCVAQMHMCIRCLLIPQTQ